MPSPFPGMDPFIEAQGCWPDFHSTFVNTWREQLLAVLPGSYDARIEERIYLSWNTGEPDRLVVADIAIEHDADADAPGGTATATLTDVEAATLTLPDPAEVRETYIEIRKHPERTLVCVLELLSPANKGSDRSAYIAKRGELIRTSVHLVELDLLLGGQRLPMWERLPDGDFYLFLSRSDQRPKSTVATWSLRQRLPRIPVPLAGPDEHVVSDLQAVFDTAWDRGRYDRILDYGKTAELPTGDDDRRWIADCIAKSNR
ncbi:MAG: DUF4058 family protein [Planctomycetaceae bacterium]